jgi:hypothetical protein
VVVIADGSTVCTQMREKRMTSLCSSVEKVIQ